jgi:trk system potassium uptake protein TrkH
MRFRPALLVVVTFAALILVGAVLLQVLIHRSGEAHPEIIASAFTSVSAVCVTGLTVIDLSRDMDFGGQLAVLVLIQIGGIGVLTLSNWVLLSLRGRLGVYGSALTHATIGAHPRVSPSRLVRRILVFTLSIEGAGALILFLRFLTDFHPRQAVWFAVFHSVSAFCNAGFSLFGDSLVGYREDVIVNATVMVLIILGGIGFVVATDVIEQMGAALHGVRRKLAVNTRLVLTTTFALILAGTFVFLVFEWNNTFSTEAVGAEFVQSFFLSVTARTAGFNTVETAHLTNMTLVIVIVFMIIGASPGSTGGGVKTTSLVVLWALVRSHLLNRPEAEITRRRIPREVVAKALALIVLYGCVVVIGMIALQGTEFGELPHQETRGLFLEHLFEVVSALSTVGLSTGVTGKFSDGGLCVLMGLMFVGRVGPLVIAASLIGERSQLEFQYAETDIMIG